MLPATLKTPRFIYWPLLNVKNEVQVKASKFLSTDWLIFTAVSLYWILKWMTEHYMWSAKLEGSEPEVFLMFKVWSVISWLDLAGLLLVVLVVYVLGNLYFYYSAVFQFEIILANTGNFLIFILLYFSTLPLLNFKFWFH